MAALNVPTGEGKGLGGGFSGKLFKQAVNTAIHGHPQNVRALEMRFRGGPANFGIQLFRDAETNNHLRGFRRAS